MSRYVTDYSLGPRPSKAPQARSVPPSKIEATAQDIAHAFDLPTIDRPWDTSDIGGHVGSRRSIAPHHLPHTLVHKVKLTQLLTKIVEEGVLIVKRGDQWRAEGITFYGLSPKTNYYARPADYARWKVAVAAKADAKRLEKAAQEALILLRDRHTGEYDTLVQQCKAALDAQEKS